MATGPITQLSDVIVPERFTSYVQQLTEEKSRLIQSGALVNDPFLNNFLSGDGLTINMPSYLDLDNDPENISSDEADDDITGLNNNSVPKKVRTTQEVAVRQSRNQSWSSADLISALISSDPMDMVANRAADYWVRRKQAMFVATVAGIFADNTAEPTGTDTHVAGDLSYDISNAGQTQGVYQAGITDFSAEAFLDSLAGIGDSEEDLSLIFMHSIVKIKAQKNNLIEFVTDSTGKIRIPTYLGRTVIVDDGMPHSNGVYESWIFGQGALRYGTGSPKVPTEVERDPKAGNGGGAEILHHRVEQAIHPVGYAYTGAPPNGGPSNSATSNNLANADSWSRVYNERKQIKLSRLVTREA